MTTERGTITRGRLTREILLAIRLLSRGRHLVADLADHVGLERRAAYRLLAALRDSGLRVEHHREGREIYYRLPPEIMVTISEETFRWLGREPSKKAREILERARERAR